MHQSGSSGMNTEGPTLTSLHEFSTPPPFTPIRLTPLEEDDVFGSFEHDGLADEDLMELGESHVPTQDYNEETVSEGTVQGKGGESNIVEEDFHGYEDDDYEADSSVFDAVMNPDVPMHRRSTETSKQKVLRDDEVHWTTPQDDLAAEFAESFDDEDVPMQDDSTTSRANPCTAHINPKSSNTQEQKDQLTCPKTIGTIPIVDLTISSSPLPQTSTEKSHPSPFVRFAFPPPATASQILPSLSPSPRILTCFRVAEVLRATSTQTTTPPLLEVFATITASNRTPNGTQHFTFSDLFYPNHPPHLPGSYVGWKGIDLFENDTNAFLKSTPQAGVKCRAICVPLKRHLESRVGQGIESSLRLRILHIWKAGWEDVEWARGLVVD